MQKLVAALAKASIAPDVWPAAEALAAFMNDMKQQDDDPRQWLGWSILADHAGVGLPQ